MTPLIDLDSSNSSSIMHNFDIWFDKLETMERQHVATEMILSINSSTGRVQVLLANNMGEVSGLKILGGKRDPIDEGIHFTGERETFEESGIKPEDKINLSYLVDDSVLTDDKHIAAARISFIGQPYSSYPSMEKDKQTNWEWYDLYEVITWCKDELYEPFIFPGLAAHFKNLVFRKNLIEYIQKLVDSYLIPEQNSVIALLQSEQ